MKRCALHVNYKNKEDFLLNYKKVEKVEKKAFITPTHHEYIERFTDLYRC